MESSSNCTCADFEQAAMSKLRSLVPLLSQDSKIFREPWGSSTVICFDFSRCPHLYSINQDQTKVISQAIIKLGLANSMIFRLGNKTIGWSKVKP
ncbi:MAG: hypothetical protein AAFQ80_09565 [Cyanobacteria bacterium J06621_8]